MQSPPPLANRIQSRCVTFTPCATRTTTFVSNPDDPIAAFGPDHVVYVLVREPDTTIAVFVPDRVVYVFDHICGVWCNVAFMSLLHPRIPREEVRLDCEFLLSPNV